METDFLLQAADEFYSKLEGQKIDLKALQQVCCHGDGAPELAL